MKVPAASSEAYPAAAELASASTCSNQSLAERRRGQEQRVRQLPRQGSHDPALQGRPSSIGCTDCHGGDANDRDQGERARPPARFPDAWSTVRPIRCATYTLLNHESPEFIHASSIRRLPHRAPELRDHRDCHPSEVATNNRKSMMTHGAMLWGAALYNNGVVPAEAGSHFGESYSMNGVPQMIVANPPPTEEDTRLRGELPFLMPLPKFENSQPANILRIFERGGKGRIEIGHPAWPSLPSQIPGPAPSVGRPEGRSSERGLGTGKPDRPGLHRLAENAAARPDPQLPRHQRPRR